MTLPRYMLVKVFVPFRPAVFGALDSASDRVIAQWPMITKQSDAKQKFDEWVDAKLREEV